MEMIDEIKAAHPGLWAKCLEMTGSDHAARLLATLFYKIETQGLAGVVLVEGEQDSERLTIPRHIRRQLRKAMREKTH